MAVAVAAVMVALSGKSLGKVMVMVMVLKSDGNTRRRPGVRCPSPLFHGRHGTREREIFTIPPQGGDGHPVLRTPVLAVIPPFMNPNARNFVVNLARVTPAGVSPVVDDHAYRSGSNRGP